MYVDCCPLFGCFNTQSSVMQAGSMTDYSELLDEDTDNGENGTLDKAHVPVRDIINY